jgi:hypothetical protein
MANVKRIQEAMKVGRRRAAKILKFRAAASKTRAKALKTHPQPLALRIQAVPQKGVLAAPATVMQTAGVLVAEGDSWFDYPLHDVLKELEDNHGYDVESVAHKGDSIEEMAYGDNQLNDFTRTIEKLLRRGVKPKAILLSGGGNDVAGDEFRMLVNHERSSIAGLNDDILEGVINKRIETAYVTVITSVTEVCKEITGQLVPILVHGYDFPVPDGRGFMGGWGPLPGPWLEPGFREKGFDHLPSCTRMAHDLIERFNTMLAGVAALPQYRHVHYIDLRNTLSTGRNYKDWWANELHPTPRGWSRVADHFVAVLQALP